MLLGVFGVLYCLLAYNPRLHNWLAESVSERANTANMKGESQLKGKRMYIPRQNKRDIRVNVYIHEQEDPSPMLFIAHDSDFTDGDADDIDEACDRLKDEWGVTIFSINYSKLPVHISTYPQEEITEAVLYFVLHAEEYGCDRSKYVLMGSGAGAYLMMIAAVSMTRKALFPNGFILLDPYLDYVLLSFAQTEIHPGPLALVFTGEATPKQEEYEYDLDHTSIPVAIRRYPDSKKGFLGRDPDDPVRMHCVRWLKDELEYYYHRERA